MMEYFHYRYNVLWAEEIPLPEIASRFDTPCYVYSRAAIEHQWRAFDQAFEKHPHQICYAVKANSNLAVLNILARLGSGFDIVSVGELERVLAAGGDPGRIVFSGVGKRADEMERALAVGIACFNVESEAELIRLNEIAGKLEQRAPVSLRVNPDVDARTHPYIATGLRDNKFGIEIDQALAVYARAATLPHIDILGVDCHIGSQLTSLSPFLAALERVLALVDQLAERGIKIRHIDLGGGLGIIYRDEAPPSPQQYAAALRQKLAGRNLEIWIEPGRAIVGNGGVLLTRIEYLKQAPQKNFAIVDAAMNDLLRPALYDAWQEIIPVAVDATGEPLFFDVVGPVCETGDFLGKRRQLAIEAGDLLVVRAAGAYGFTMSSNYNSRPRAAEIMVDGAEAHLVRERETVESLYRGEATLPG
ncbi:diaminopimelate decarboxylase [Nitrosococcus oceani ATCC 19707]|uniref:Diaminopimelate decarboxylase n=2 Tax=Nitrosococcus oceani TaxID=1229 RepID=Q3JEA4_NITOC|nr:diaminopimelate decarboxylase [Nitrosococcus oceani ATCC 19707]EDZ66450.1 diaminopimelate decarboxylase [Nitrosococcus oceani AFC27]GEM20598.1 diaminopimelate decarboxylase [Nitrosococcus oceani]